MTQTKTVSTERLNAALGSHTVEQMVAKILRRYDSDVPQIKQFLRDGEDVVLVTYIRELLASRTQDPAEWQVELPDDLRPTFPSSLPANWPDVLESRAKAAYLEDSKGTVDLLRATAIYLRAASITPPAQERSKEEARASTIFQAIRGYLGAVVSHADVMAAIEAALEPASLHKGEAVAWEGYWPGAGSISSATKLTKDKNTAVRWQDDGAEITPLYASPALLPVGVTDAVVEASYHAGMLGLDREGHRNALTAALSKPGEQG